jgi:hypothetical protein
MDGVRLKAALCGGIFANCLFLQIAYVWLAVPTQFWLMNAGLCVSAVVATVKYG